MRRREGRERRRLRDVELGEQLLGVAEWLDLEFVALGRWLHSGVGSLDLYEIGRNKPRRRRALEVIRRTLGPVSEPEAPQPVDAAPEPAEPTAAAEPVESEPVEPMTEPVEPMTEAGQEAGEMEGEAIETLVEEAEEIFAELDRRRASSLEAEVEALEVEAEVEEPERGPGERAELLRLELALKEAAFGGEEHREKVQEMIDRMGERAEAQLREVLLDARPAVAEVALEELVRLEAAGVDELVELLGESGDEAMRLVALKAALQRRGRGARLLLERAAGDPSPTLRRRAVTYLSWRQDAWALSLIRQMTADGDGVVRWSAIEAIAAVDLEEARAIVATLDDDEVMTSKLAALVTGEEERSEPERVDGDHSPEREAVEEMESRNGL